MYKNMLGIVSHGVLLVALTIGSAFAQDAGNTTSNTSPDARTASSRDRDNDFNWGWLGLLGLGGLAGLMRRDQDVRSRSTRGGADTRHVGAA